MSVDNVTVGIAITRLGGPGAEWRASAVSDRVLGGLPLEVGPASSPGEVLEALGQRLDALEAEAIVGARRSSS